MDTYYSNHYNASTDNTKFLTPFVMDRIRIACFRDSSENKQDELGEKLMWAHYADGYKGIRLKYNIKDGAFQTIRPNSKFDKQPLLNKVGYKKNLIGFYSNLFGQQMEKYEGEQDFLQTVYFMKDEEYNYEKEIRLLMYDEQNKNDYIPYRFTYLEGITFGSKCPQNIRDLLIEINVGIYNNRLQLSQISDNLKEEKYEYERKRVDTSCIPGLYGEKTT